VDGPLHQLGRRTGLYDVHVDKDITVLRGCGLGGTSLINANVAIRADPRVFEDLRWPTELRRDLEHGLKAGYARAEAMLKPQTYPANRPELKKVSHLRACAEHLGEKCYLTPINVAFESGVNHVGVEQKACNDCGDCVTGCNYASKNTTRVNYLPDAWNHGAEIFCEVDVVSIRRVANRWLVIVRPLDVGRELFDAPAIHVFADIVVLGAGALGSTEILLRSAEAGLPVSRLLGHRFTGNGDVIGFSYNGEVPINSFGMGTQNPVGNDACGPCITAFIDARENRPLEDGTIIEDGTIPGGIGVFAATMMASTAVAQGKALSADFATTLKREKRELDTAMRGPLHGATNNSQTLFVMAHDGDDGRMQLENGHLKINWPGVGKRPIFEKANEMLAKATEMTKGIYLRNPIWSNLFEQPLLTVHPLGGCCMGDNAQTGVVDHKGQVFDGAGASSVHPGFYVMDGSILPLSLGVNPLLTISAVAERCADLAIHQHGWSISYDLPSLPPSNIEPPTVGVRFTETMKGHFTTRDLDYKAADEAGKANGDAFRFVLTIQADDLEKLLVDEHYLSTMVGSVEAPMLSPEPLTVTNGKFTLFVRNPAEPSVKNMIYHMSLTARDGTQYWFEGFKVIRDDKGVDIWSDTTTLYVTVWQGISNAGPLVGRGILYITPDDFLKQLTTTKITNAPGKVAEAKNLVRFGMHFMGELWKTFGIHFVRESV
jgi:cholesterol oxidase